MSNLRVERWVKVYAFLSFAIVVLILLAPRDAARPTAAVLVVFWMVFLVCIMVWSGGVHMGHLVWWKKMLAGIGFVVFLFIVAGAINTLTGAD